MTIITNFTPVFAKVCFAEHCTPVEGFAKEPFYSRVSLGNVTWNTFGRFTVDNGVLKALRSPVINTVSFDGERMQPCEVDFSDGSYKI